MTPNAPAECPSCAEPDPIFYEGEGGEPDILSCPECGWEVLA